MNKRFTVKVIDYDLILNNEPIDLSTIGKRDILVIDNEKQIFWDVSKNSENFENTVFKQIPQLIENKQQPMPTAYTILDKHQDINQEIEKYWTKYALDEMKDFVWGNYIEQKHQEFNQEQDFNILTANNKEIEENKQEWKNKLLEEHSYREWYEDFDINEFGFNDLTKALEFAKQPQEKISLAIKNKSQQNVNSFSR